MAQRNIKNEIFRVDVDLYMSTRLLANQRSEFTNAILHVLYVKYLHVKIQILQYSS
jgi:hypothetical protein